MTGASAVSSDESTYKHVVKSPHRGGQSPMFLEFRATILLNALFGRTSTLSAKAEICTH